MWYTYHIKQYVTHQQKWLLCSNKDVKQSLFLFFVFSTVAYTSYAPSMLCIERFLQLASMTLTIGMLSEHTNCRYVSSGLSVCTYTNMNCNSFCLHSTLSIFLFIFSPLALILVVISLANTVSLQLMGAGTQL